MFVLHQRDRGNDRDMLCSCWRWRIVAVAGVVCTLYHLGVILSCWGDDFVPRWTADDLTMAPLGWPWLAEEAGVLRIKMPLMIVF